ncbi:hypothetical protein KTC96_17270 [Clostridium estertheticum]|uniref:hypothetical protein n=1 Tax=Clostridium estertheticum TaxID=238834 RepID=UPI001C7E0421|nr:hypothetical protein [Clostridium estertheticum]MBX4258361.1 hypothetical protein [Clostridium estertheticum]WLC69678.1 hypothetical protein KTC96_17270 [Clostridium estertheticum]
MSWTKRISIWIVVSLSLQCLGLFYIDHYFLATDSKAISKKVVEDVSAKAKDVDITIPTSAENILVSYDAKYISYYDDKKLVIVNCLTGKTKNIESEDGCNVSFASWVTGRNRMSLVEKESDDESSDLILYSYDVVKGEKVKTIKLDWGGTNTKVEDIQTAPLTGLTYVKVSNNANKSSIYRIDRNPDMSKIDTIPKLVGNIALIRHEDKLVYEGSVYNKIYVTGKSDAISVGDVDKLTLIGSDNDDNIYLAQLKDNLISKVYYGKTSQDTSTWKTIDLQIPCAKEKLLLSTSGKIYQNDPLKGIIKDINSGTETSYKGKFVQLYNKGVVSLENNKISFVLFK